MFVWGTKQQVKHQFVQVQVQEKVEGVSMSGDAGEEEALVFMLTSWCDIKTKKQIALRSRSQTEREPWSPEGSSSL